MPLTTLTHSELAPSGISRFLHALGKARRCAGPGRAHLQTAGCLEPANTLRIPRGSGDVCLECSAHSLGKMLPVSSFPMYQQLHFAELAGGGLEETPPTNRSPVAIPAIAYLLFWSLIRVAAAVPGVQGHREPCFQRPPPALNAQPWVRRHEPARRRHAPLLPAERGLARALWLRPPRWEPGSLSCPLHSRPRGASGKAAALMDHKRGAG